MIKTYENLDIENFLNSENKIHNRVIPRHMKESVLKSYTKERRPLELQQIQTY